MTEAEIEKKWENTPWDTDIYLDDIDDWGVCKDCAIKDNCSHHRPCKLQCEDYEREPQTNFEQITKDEATLTDWLQEKMCFCTEISCDECIAYKECWHQGNDTDYSNADLWNAWLKQHKGE